MAVLPGVTMHRVVGRGGGGGRRAEGVWDAWTGSSAPVVLLKAL